MTKEFEKLESVFKNERPPRASKTAKQLAMSAAMQAFEENKSHTRQGNWISKRLKGQDNKFGNKLVELITLSEWRKSMKLSYFLAGGTSIAVLTLAIANTGQFQEYFQTSPSTITAPDTKPGKVIKTAELELNKTVKLKQRDEKTRSNTAVDQKLLAEAKPKKNRAATQNNQMFPSKLSARKDKRDDAGKGNAIDQMAAVAPASPPASPSVSRPSIVMPKPVGGLRRAKIKKQMLAGRISGASRERAALSMPARPEPIQPGFIAQGRDKFEEIVSNPQKFTSKDPVSTFSIDVDTASYSFMRAAINRNALPPKDSVRVEELINYFPYDYQGPISKDVPFKANVTVFPTPWNTATKLVHIGIKGFDIKQSEKPKSNLVFLLDTSGSMNAANKLPLLKNSFKLLLSTLGPDDVVSIVAYAGSAGVVLEPTKASNKHKILAALDRLRAGGSTAGGQGIKLAYQLAQSNFDKKGVNRVILATDGDFNVGIRNRNELKSFVERKRNTGVMLSVLGFGMGNYNDALMQTLAQNGNGNAAYIDSLSEARKVLVQEASSTLFTIAKDVKIQMEFNPLTVRSYRLIGYETRKLKREDFNNDKVDAGDIGSGHTVTAIYEITPVGSGGGLVDPLRYGKKGDVKVPVTQQATTGEYGFLKLRYKLPNKSKSQLIETAVKIDEAFKSIDEVSISVRFSSAVAAYGQLLRGGKNIKSFSYDDVIELATSAKGKDEFGYRAEFINLVRLAKIAAGFSRSNN